MLTQLGFNATLKVIAGDVYWTTIGNQSTPDLDTGFGDWFQDFPHPDDFFRPLLNGASILPTNGNNYSRVSYPRARRQDERASHASSSPTGVKKQYAALDKAYMEQAVVGAVRQRGVHHVPLRADGLRQDLPPSAVQPGLLRRSPLK